MMEWISWAPWGVAFAAVVAFTASATAARRGRARGAELARRVGALEEMLRASCSAQARAGDRLIDAECELRRIGQSVARLDLRAPGTGAYRQAEMLAARGMPSEELVATCGIGHEEAALLCLIHRHGEAAPRRSGSDVH